MVVCYKINMHSPWYPKGFRYVKNEKNKGALLKFQEDIETKRLEILYSKTVADFNTMIIQCKDISVKLIYLFKKVCMESLQHSKHKIFDSKHGFTTVNNNQNFADNVTHNESNGAYNAVKHIENMKCEDLQNTYIILCNAKRKNDKDVKKKRKHNVGNTIITKTSKFSWKKHYKEAVDDMEEVLRDWIVTYMQQKDLQCAKEYNAMLNKSKEINKIIPNNMCQKLYVTNHLKFCSKVRDPMMELLYEHGELHTINVK